MQRNPQMTPRSNEARADKGKSGSATPLARRCAQIRRAVALWSERRWSIERRDRGRTSQ